MQLFLKRYISMFYVIFSFIFFERISKLSRWANFVDYRVVKKKILFTFVLRSSKIKKDLYAQET